MGNAIEHSPVQPLSAPTGPPSYDSATPAAPAPPRPAYPPYTLAGKHSPLQPTAVAGWVPAGLRPRALDEFVGQRELKEHLRIVLEAARRREQPVDHLLFAGPPGLGKTTLAGIVATEMGVRLRSE